MRLSLQKTQEADLETLFEIQQNEEAQLLAAFISVQHQNRDSFIKKFKGLIEDKEVLLMSIYLGNKVIGSIAKYMLENRSEITYWTSRDFWGKGYTTEAVRLFLEEMQTRPIYARTAFDNFPSHKVLTKNGFKEIGRETAYAYGRDREIEEIIFRLDT